MHRPPTIIPGPDHANAFDNIPVRNRPDHAGVTCVKCRGRGAWNIEIHDHGRSRITACDACQGAGWVDRDGWRRVHDIVLVDGHPTWTIRMEHHARTQGGVEAETVMV